MERGYELLFGSKAKPGELELLLHPGPDPDSEPLSIGPTPPTKLVNPATAAKRLGVSLRTFNRMQAAGRGPKPIRPSGNPLGNRVYRERDLDAWINRRPS